MESRGVFNLNKLSCIFDIRRHDSMRMSMNRACTAVESCFPIIEELNQSLKVGAEDKSLDTFIFSLPLTQFFCEAQGKGRAKG